MSIFGIGGYSFYLTMFCKSVIILSKKRKEATVCIIARIVTNSGEMMKVAGRVRNAMKTMPFTLLLA